MCKQTYFVALMLLASLNQPAVAQRWSHFQSFGDVHRARYDRRAQIYWFGTLSNGLWRFDGRDFARLNLPSTPYGSVNEITALAVDEKNSALWVGSRLGLFRYQEKPQDWKYYDWKPGSNRPECLLKTPHVTALFVDTGGNLWYGFDSTSVGKKDATGWYRYTTRGCTKWDSVQACWVNFPCREPLPNFDENGNFITCITQDAQGNMYFGTRKTGVLVLDTMGKWTLIAEFPSDSNKTISAIAVDNRKNKWLATSGGVCLLDSTDTFVKCLTADSGLVDNKVNAIWIEAFQNGDMKWFGTGAGVSRLDSTNRNWKTFTQRNSGLPYDDVQDMIGDDDGNLWFAAIRSASGGEVSKLDLKWSEQTLDDGLSSDFTHAVERDRAGRLWVGTDRRGLASFGGVDVFNGGKWQHVELGTDCSTRPRARDFLPDGADMWIATTGCGIFKVSQKLEIIAKFRDTEPPERRLPSNNVFALARRKNILWAGTDNGLVAILIDGQNFRVDPALRPVLPSLDVAALAHDRGDRLWAGTARGLSVYDGQKSTEIPIPFFAPNTAITALAFDTKNNLWVGTPVGLARFDSSKGWTSFSTTDRLPDNGITAIDVAPDGTVWIGTANGAAAFYDEKWTAYTTIDGLSDNLVYQIAFGPPEVVWLATWGGGVSRYRRTGVRPNTYILKSFDIVTAPKVVFHYSGYDFNTPVEQLRYQYALDDTSVSSWSPVTSANFVELTIPESNKHVFFVRAIDRDGNRDLSPAQMPFYKILWNRGAAVTFVDSSATRAQSAIQLYFPPQALQEGISIRATPIGADSLRLNSDEKKRFINIAYQLSASEKVLSEKRPLTVKVFYGAAIAHNFDERRLGIYRHDGQRWHCLGGTVDKKQHCLTTTVTELGTIALFAEAECAKLAEDKNAFNLAVQPRMFSPAGDLYAKNVAISFDLEAAGAVTIKVYNLAGRLVKSLCENQMMNAGRNAVNWDGFDYHPKRCPGGMYLICLQAAGQTATKTVMVVNQ
jgi:ligand-binding sensor domain-containing protein